MGNSPAAVAYDTGYVALANQIEHFRRQLVLLQDGAVELKEGTLLVCGFEMVGKTTLVQALKFKQVTTMGIKHSPLAMLRNTLTGTDRTAGFDVTKFTIPHAGEAAWTVVDLRGTWNTMSRTRCC